MTSFYRQDRIVVRADDEGRGVVRESSSLFRRSSDGTACSGQMSSCFLALETTQGHAAPGRAVQLADNVISVSMSEMLKHL